MMPANDHQPEAPIADPLRPPLPRPGEGAPRDRTPDRIRWEELRGASAALALAEGARTSAAPLLVVTPDAAGAERIAVAVRFFLGEARPGHDPARSGSGEERDRPSPEAIPVLRFPDWETLPYDLFSPHQAIVSERIATLCALPSMTRGVVVVSAQTLMGRLPPRRFIDAHSLRVRTGERLDVEALRARLEQAGYVRVGEVREPGEFAVRGSLVDLFPMGSERPVRIDRFDDEIESIRLFDPDTQRSLGTVPNVELLPAREFPLTEQGITTFRRRWRARFEGDPRASNLYRDVSEGLAPSGIEYYLPLFHEELALLTDYLPPGSIVAELEGSHEAAESFMGEVRERWEERRHDRERPVLDPTEIFAPVEEVYAALGKHPRVVLERPGTGPETDSGDPGSVPAPEVPAPGGQPPRRGRAGTHRFATRRPPSLPVEARAAEPYRHLREFLERFRDGEGGRVLVVADSLGRQETLVETLARHGMRPERVESWSAFRNGEAPFAITVADTGDGAADALGEGFILPPSPSLPAPVALLSEQHLFGERARQRRPPRTRARDPETVLRDLTELEVGAPIVHEQHGVGRYLGLETLEAGGTVGEYLAIEYADGDRVYVPVLSLHLVSRYAGVDVEHAPLHKLGSGQWQKARRRAAEKVRDVAAELLDIQARRAARPGQAYPLDEEAYEAFVQGFPFDETPDQEEAIGAVLADMTGPGAMDRLVCGDVGFGKTEVAMRAAFVAAMAGAQVAVLVPTTLLAQQHYRTFSDRFAEWPVRIAELSRFRSRRQRDEIVRELAEGRIDIVIGTHRLLEADVRFRNLGLVIVDEEHRFGVRHKERLKSLRAEVDILTLTATPIPRTLNMALAELRDLSLIATPPEDRLSVKTFVARWEGALIREALHRELRRGGQAYFVHNRVEDIEQIARRVSELVPEARIEVAHGQMSERDLERIMLDFYHRRFNVLVCTTIIETGIDVPSANTIIINRADRFGLAQLHQLRGRVGRSHHRAYAYLLAPDPRRLKPDAQRRLDAIASLDELGVGFSLAVHDLEIRGAGELLGDEQSGQMHEIGYALYSELLERAVRDLRRGAAPELDRPLEHGTEMDLHVPALIPETYLPDVHSRLILYKRIASARSPEALHELEVEMIDRFGLLPEPVRTLLRITRAKLATTPLGIRKVDLGARGGRVQFEETPDIDPGALVGLLQSHPTRYRLDGPTRLRIVEELPTLEARLALLEELVTALAPRDGAKEAAA